MSKLITVDDCKKRFIKTHGDKYDYSKVEYKDCKTKVCIICPIHGEFWQTPHNHANGQGCPKCALEKTKSLQREKCERAKKCFVEKARVVHGDKYDYSKVEYANALTKVCIICPIHGEFWQKPSAHLNGNGCPKCNKTFKMNTEEFIERAKKVHGDKYDYTNVKYISSKRNVCIICLEHGEFWQRPNDHLSGHGCYKCNCHNHTKDFNNFVKLANKIHSEKYEYVEETYVNRQTKTKIICPEHGEFFQEPRYHLQGNGCPVCGHKCNVSEQQLYFSLKKIFPNEEILYQYRNHDLLGMMSFDIYIPKYKIAIEHQGIQHFEAVKRFGGKNKLEEIKKRDILKRDICIKNNIKILYISLYDNVLKYSSEEMRIISSIDELCTKIKEIIE